MQPGDGSWQVVAASADVPAGVMRPFDVGSVVGFVVGSTANPRRSRGCARTRAAGCGSKGP